MSVDILRHVHAELKELIAPIEPACLIPLPPPLPNTAGSLIFLCIIPLQWKSNSYHTSPVYMRYLRRSHSGMVETSGWPSSLMHTPR
jgi:hypothetical protein